ncbi:MAG: hypothetical protein H6613_13270 [Ignavibacteriales bacterium]|nr:hypothetical protein [Ignavibacteriales bacterium]
MQGIIQQQNLTSNSLDANYGQYAKTINPDSLYLSEINLYFRPRTEERYNATITLDYEIPNGSLAFTNILSQSNSKNNYFRQQYGLERGGNNIHYYADGSDNELNLITNILNFNQKHPSQTLMQRFRIHIPRIFLLIHGTYNLNSFLPELIKLMISYHLL